MPAEDPSLEETVAMLEEEAPLEDDVVSGGGAIRGALSSRRLIGTDCDAGMSLAELRETALLRAETGTALRVNERVSSTRWASRC